MSTLYLLNKAYSFFKFCETKRFNLLTIMAKIMYNIFDKKRFKKRNGGNDVKAY